MGRRGRLEVITGTMFAGKTTELLKRLPPLNEEGTLLFTKDSRFGEGRVGTHDGHEVVGGRIYFVKDSQEIEQVLRDLEGTEDIREIGIDEVQFFDESVVDVCRRWALRGKRIVCSGLVQDFRGEPFLTTLLLVAEAEEVVRLSSKCSGCGAGETALRNYRILETKDRVAEGGSGDYKPLCRICYGEKVK